MKPPHLLTLADLSEGQIQALLDSAAHLKAACKATSLAVPAAQRQVPKAGPGGLHPIEQSLTGKTIAILFSKRSTRTRVASETSVAALGEWGCGKLRGLGRAWEGKGREGKGTEMPGWPSELDASAKNSGRNHGMKMMGISRTADAPSVHSEKDMR